MTATATNAPSNTTPISTRLVGLTPAELARLYREIRQSLLLSQSPAVTDNSNVVGVRLTHDEKRGIEILAAMHRHKVSDELRTAIRSHLQQRHRSIDRFAGDADDAAEPRPRASRTPSLSL